MKAVALPLLALMLLTAVACTESSTPERMREFIALHATLRQTQQNGTSVQKEQVPADRRKALADFMAKGAAFTDWPVEVVDVRTEGGSGIGKLVSDKPVAVLRVTFGGIALENSYVEILMESPENVIAEGTPLYGQVTGLKKGQKVKVSGSFVANKEGLPRELSLTVDGALEKPEYVVVFTAVAP